MRCLTCSNLAATKDNLALVKRHILIHALNDNKDLNFPPTHVNMIPKDWGSYYATLQLSILKTERTYCCVIYSYNRYTFRYNNPHGYAVINYDFTCMKEFYFYIVSKLKLM